MPDHSHEESHYDLLGVDMFASREAIEAAVERVSKQAQALANVAPERSQFVQELLRAAKADLLTGEERRNAYNRRLLERMGKNDSGDAVVSGYAPPPPPPGPRPRPGPAPVAPDRPQPSRTPFWIAGGLVILLIAIVAGGLLGRSNVLSHSAAPATATGVPTGPAVPTAAPAAVIVATPAPAPTADPQAAALQSIHSTLIHSNRAFVDSMNCACDAGLESYKTGADLQKYLSQIAQLHSNNEHWQITPHSYTVERVTLQLPGSATATVTKDETRILYQNGSKTYVCSGPYQVRYHLIPVGGTWKVDNTTVVGAGQSCQNE